MPVTADTFRLKARHSGKCITLPAAQGGAVTQRPCDEARQEFRLER